MGTAHSLAHRLTALSMACFASAGIIFSIFAGLSCSFVQVAAQPGSNLMSANGDLFDAQVAFFGVMCRDSPFYDESDRMWGLSQIFFYSTVGIGGLTTLVAWALTLCIPPTGCRWRTMSILSAITAVMQVPVFLIFESDNCTFDVNRQTCKLAMGAYMNMMAIIIWVVMTIWAQCLKPPEWNKEGLHAWKVESNTNSPSTISKRGPDEPRSFYSTESGGSDEEDFFHPPHSPRVRNSQLGTNHDQSSEIHWVSREEQAMHRRNGPTRFSPRGVALPEEEIAEENIQRDASCMERILYRRNRNSKNDSPSNYTSTACMSSPNEEKHHIDMVQETAASVMHSTEACHDLSGMTFSVSGKSQDAICGIATCHDGLYPMDEANKSTDKSTDSHSKSQANDQKCPEVTVSCVAQHMTQLPSAVAACIVSSCEEEQEESGEFQMVDGVPVAPTKNASGGRRGIRGVSDDDLDEHDEEETSRIDYLTKRMRSDMAATANIEARSKIAPMTTIHIDTTYIQEHDHNDDMSEMTRGSGLASGVSEVLDSQRHHKDEDPMTILDDLARNY
ncbi:hypothetical protein IV203_030679 [Nitzschia inconspicua]|uniref:Uncharacterized protein n=1 Tax=Nitzschia inconspicua TaxID=303405 RepID=A0A9K3LWF5_9STRA|nr:hypothetical protein IV203_030679 [Nitzschia inconspicua]